jgi:hypothetical protein
MKIPESYEQSIDFMKEDIIQFGAVLSDTAIHHISAGLGGLEEAIEVAQADVAADAERAFSQTMVDMARVLGPQA